jgi:hypothetical protein
MRVARRPEVFVRPLDADEAQRLVEITRKSTNRVRLRRAMIVLFSFQGSSVPEIAKVTRGDEGYIRQVIKDFNAHGFDGLNPKWGPTDVSVGSHAAAGGGGRVGSRRARASRER